MKISFSGRAWVGYRWWQEQGRAELARVNALIDDAERHPFTGIGKPEPLKGGDEYRGYWSRRITQEHRLVYRMTGKGDEQALEIVQCRFHYAR